MKEIIQLQCMKTGIDVEALHGGGRARLRSTIAFDLGIPYAEIGRQLGITTSAIPRIMERKSC